MYYRPFRAQRQGTPVSVTVMHTLMMGTFPIVLEDRTGQLFSARVDIIQDVIATYSSLDDVL